MKFLIDLNLPPSWINLLKNTGWNATHWSKVGSLTASDAEIMEYASTHGYIAFTHDLDFGKLLALTNSSAPSVVQLRTQDVMPSKVGSLVINALRQGEVQITSGAIMSIDIHNARIRMLPFNKTNS